MAEVYRIEIPISIKDNTEPGVSQAKNKLNALIKQVKGPRNGWSR